MPWVIKSSHDPLIFITMMQWSNLLYLPVPGDILSSSGVTLSPCPRGLHHSPSRAFCGHPSCTSWVTASSRCHKSQGCSLMFNIQKPVCCGAVQLEPLHQCRPAAFINASVLAPVPAHVWLHFSDIINTHQWQHLPVTLGQQIHAPLIVNVLLFLLKVLHNYLLQFVSSSAHVKSYVYS